MKDFFTFRSMITLPLIQAPFAGGSAAWLVDALDAIVLTAFGGLLGAAAQGGSA
jgi:hypothetical protein